VRWTVTIKDQTYGVHTEVNAYECRVTRSGGEIRLSALLLACAGESERIDIVFSVEEPKVKR
jgi:hypothetical protein